MIQRAKDGDTLAFDALIALHREVMFRYAYLIVYDAHVAEDVTQDAVLRIYTHLHRFDESYAFRAWALGITRNLARNQNRAWGRYKHMLQRFTQANRRESVDIETLTQAQQQAQQLHEAVRQLKPDYQDVIYARFFMGLSVEASAAVLEIAEGTVKSRSHRALKQLKTIIETHYPQLKQDITYA